MATWRLAFRLSFDTNACNSSCTDLFDEVSVNRRCLTCHTCTNLLMSFRDVVPSLRLPVWTAPLLPESYPFGFHLRRRRYEPTAEATTITSPSIVAVGSWLVEATKQTNARAAGGSSPPGHRPSAACPMSIPEERGQYWIGHLNMRRLHRPLGWGLGQFCQASSHRLIRKREGKRPRWTRQRYLCVRCGQICDFHGLGCFAMGLDLFDDRPLLQA